MEDGVELTAVETSRALGLHISTVLRLAREGAFPGSRLGDGSRRKGYAIPEKAVLDRAAQGKAGQMVKAQAVIDRVRLDRQREAAAFRASLDETA